MEREECEGLRWYFDRFPEAFRFVALALCTCVAVGEADERADSLDQAAAELADRYRGQLDELAKWCDEKGLAEQSRETKAWVPQQDPAKLYVAVLAVDVGSVKLPRDWKRSTNGTNASRRLRRRAGQAMYDLAQAGGPAGPRFAGVRPGAGGLRENPDHEDVRRILGYQEFRGRWHTAYEVRKLRGGKGLERTFGWLRPDCGPL